MCKIISAACGMFLAVCLLAAPANAHDVIVKRNSNLRAEATTASAVLKLLKPGNEAILLDRTKRAGYFRVLPKVSVGFLWGNVGFLWGNNVRILPEYDRGQWKHWVDADGDCQKARDEVLIAESTIPVMFKAGATCKVIAGRWLGMDV
jgi:hypothetical protein